ncbi:MAG TPA: XdhC family protein [Pirellulales bacterium]|nr:XdhC family protein [Pirellulales bacterium]
MHKLISDLVDAQKSGRPVVYCRLVETRGSTPQKAGAAMLVFADGSQAGTLGGGCVEAEVKRRALAAFDEGQAEITSFQLDSDYGWDDGLICGGRMQILVEPLVKADANGYFQTYLELLDRGEGCIEAIVFDAEKSGLPAPACYLFDAQGRLVAADLQADLPTAPPAVLEHLPPLADRPRARAERGVAYLPVLPRCRLLIVGGGHIGQAVGNWAADLGFDVWVVDDREEFVSPTRFPRAERLICGEIGPTLKNLEITPDTYCIIVTRGHNHDEEALFHLVNRQARYVGLIGSRRKIKLIFDDLEAEGVSAEALAKVYAPLGIDIGSQTVPEIAISILAELVAHRNMNGAVPGRSEWGMVGEE